MLKRVPGRRERAVYLAVIAMQMICLLAVMARYRTVARAAEGQKVHHQRVQQLCELLQDTMTERDLNAANLRDTRVRLKFYEGQHPESYGASLDALGIAPEHR